MTMPLPSVIVLKNYVRPRVRNAPIFTRRNVFLRDKFCCQVSRWEGFPDLAWPLASTLDPLSSHRSVCRSPIQYCRKTLPPSELTYDHVIPRAKNGGTSWENVVTACPKCNVRKGSKLLKDLPADMLNGPRIQPHMPTWAELQQNARLFPPKVMHDDWLDYLGAAMADPAKDGEDWGI